MKKILLLVLTLAMLAAAAFAAEGVNGPGVPDTVLAAETLTGPYVTDTVLIAETPTAFMPRENPAAVESGRGETRSSKTINIFETKLVSFINIKTAGFNSFNIKNENALNIVSGFNGVIREALSLREA